MVKHSIKIAVLLCIVVLLGCSSPDPETIIVQETVIAELPITIEVTRQVTVEVEVTSVTFVQIVAEIEKTA